MVVHLQTNNVSTDALAFLHQKEVTFTYYTKTLHNPPQVKSLFIELAPMLKLQ